MSYFCVCVLETVFAQNHMQRTAEVDLLRGDVWLRGKMLMFGLQVVEDKNHVLKSCNFVHTTFLSILSFC